MSLEGEQNVLLVFWPSRGGSQLREVSQNLNRAWWNQTDQSGTLGNVDLHSQTRLEAMSGESLRSQGRKNVVFFSPQFSLLTCACDVPGSGERALGPGVESWLLYLPLLSMVGDLGRFHVLQCAGILCSKARVFMIPDDFPYPEKEPGRTG